MQSCIGFRMCLDVMHHLRDPRGGHHHAERSRRARLQHLLNSQVGVVRHSRVIHVQDQDAVGFFPTEFFSVRSSSLRATGAANQGRKQQSLGHAAFSLFLSWRIN